MTTAGTYLRKSWRACAIAIAFLAMITVGYLTISVVSSCPAEAQLCGCSVVCVMQGPTSVSALYAMVTAQSSAQITTATGLINTQYALAAEAFSLQAAIRFAQVVFDIWDWFDTFWYYNEKPSMQAQVEQANVMETVQATTMSMFRDAADTIRSNHVTKELQFQSEREASPSVQICMAATASGGMFRANTITDAYGRAAAAAAGPRSGGALGSDGARGAAADIAMRAERVRWTYCDMSENGGINDCRAQEGPLVNADIDAATTIFSRDTIDLLDPSTRAAVDALVINVAEPVVQNNIPREKIATAQGMEQQMRRDETRAQRQTIHTALQYVIARRAPSGSNGQFIAAIRDSAGIPPDLLSENPSYHEIMEAMLTERFRTGRYSVEQIDTPANADRDLAVQNAFQVMQMNDQLELLDRYSLMLAAEMGLEAREQRRDSGLDRREQRR